MHDALAMADKYTNLLLGLASLWALIVVLGAGVWYYRRRWRLSDSQSAGDAWTLADLRKLRDTGRMTEEEFQKVRAAMIAGLHAGSDDPQGRPGPADTSDRSRSGGILR
ncbi:MAG: hypothetical protein ACPMAQ_08140 [Phycisphaerae bacterium]